MHEVTQLVRNRGRIRLDSDERLGEAMTRSAGLPDLRARLVAESIHRAWLRGAGGTESLGASGFPEAWRVCGLSTELAESLREWIADQRRERSWQPPALWSERAPAAWRLELDRLLQIWRHADGFIPVVSQLPQCAGAVALPFRLYEGGEGFAHLCHGNRGARCGADFQEALDAAAWIATDLRWRQGRRSLVLELASLDGSCGVAISGQSAGLPILLAIGLRHEGLRAPAFAWGASGVLEPARSRLASLDLSEAYERKAALMDSMGIGRTILPGGEGDRWDPADALDSLLADLCARLRTRGDAKDDAREGLFEKIRKCMNDMHVGYVDASRIERELTILIRVHLPEDRPWLRQARAEALLGLAAARNHLGNAEEAQRALQESLELAADMSATLEGDALVRQAVILQDLGDYEAADRSCQQALSLSDRYADAGIALPLELEMKACGTRGQVLACSALESGCGATARESLELLRRARDRARERDGGRVADPEAPRNAVYVYWWHALHAPGLAAEAWDEAREAAAADTNPVTMDYLVRHRWLAVYRRLVLTGSSPAWIEEVDESRIPERGWLRGTCLKYRGAWRARAGRTEAAQEDFSRAIETLTERHGEREAAPLFRFFAATAALQAAESLGGGGGGVDPRHLQQARELFEGVPGVSSWFPKRKFRGEVWMRRIDALASGTPDLPDPQKHFPY